MAKQKRTPKQKKMELNNQKFMAKPDKEKLWEYIPEIEWVAVAEIKPYEFNAKIHPASQVKAIAESIRSNGWVQPLVIDAKNVITIGHGRVEAAKLLGANKVPVFRAEHLSEMQIRVLRLSDNKLNESPWDMKMVKIELKDFPVDMIKLAGFNPDIVVEVKPEDDDAPDLPAVPKSKLGDIYQLGDHRLGCGDSTSIAWIEKLMDGQKADCVITDPPYNVDYSGRGKNTSNKIMNDKMTVEQFVVFLDATFATYRSAAKDNCPFYVCHSSSSQITFEESMVKSGLKVKNQIIWNKSIASMGWGDYRRKHEPIFYASYGGKEVPFYGDRSEYTVWDESWDLERAEKELKKIAEKQDKGGSTIWKISRDTDYKHPTQKPIELITIALRNSSKDGDIVLDLFGGSGSTLIGCEKMHRRCFTNELDPKYCDVIIERFEKYTGEKAVKLN